MKLKQLIALTKDLNILYVEDEDNLRKETNSFLKTLFATADEAVDGKDGLNKYNDYFKKNKKYYDIVITDINMPNLDGIEMSKEILAKNKDQFIIVITAYNDSDRLQKIIDLGIRSFVHKPGDMDKIIAEIYKAASIIKDRKLKIKYIDSIAKLNKELDSLVEGYDSYVIASRTDLKGIITYASKAFADISGYSKDELIGRSHNIVRHPDMPKELFEDLWNTIKQEKTWHGEIKNKRKDGSWYWVNAKISPLYDSDGILIGYSGIREKITAKKELEELNQKLEKLVAKRTKEIENLLYYDKLTGLKTQSALIDDMRGKSFSALFLINIDGFQTINKLYGFDSGDSILIQFAEFLKTFNKDKSYELYHIYGDIFVLYEGDNFVRIEEYEKDLRLLKKHIQTYSFYLQDFEEHLELDATIGVSLGQENPLATADMALTHAKEHKLGFTTYNTTLDRTEEFHNTVMWKKKIKSALENNMVFPVYQPIFDRNGKIKKYEVLMRIADNSKKKETIHMPGEFLAAAIKTKQYSSLSKVIIKKSFKQMDKKRNCFSINISFEDIYNNSLINTLEKELKKYPHLKDKLIMEILETEEIYDAEVMEEFIAKFRDLGVRIAIDDFGTGHSNFSHILEINPDYIKIDGSFIKNIDNDKASHAMVKAIVEFAKELNIKTIAEYVHSKEVYDIVKGLGIDEFQGFYLSACLKEI